MHARCRVDKEVLVFLLLYIELEDVTSALVLLRLCIAACLK